MSTLNRCRLAAVVFVWVLVSTVSVAQTPPGQGPAVVSPEILADNHVAIRIFAPRASEVALHGDWMEGFTPEKLTKDEEGVWSVTVGPLTPDYYSYTLLVDRVKTLDPRNPEIKQGVRGVDNMFFLDGEASQFEANREVPHGQIRKVWYSSATLGTQRRMHVYTPPAYDSGTERFPVLYLLHGGGDEDSGWSTIGRAGFILDNLLAAGKARPMIIVMPNGSLPMPPDLPRFVPGQTPPPEVVAAIRAAQSRFVDELMKEIVPRVEQRFRARGQREQRAIAGLSMGGGHTLSVVAGHPDQFAYVAIWSAGIWSDAPGWEKQNAEFLGDPNLNEWFKLLSLSAGDKDFALKGCQDLARILDEHGIHHELHISGGGHTWINWRHYLNELLPKLF